MANNKSVSQRGVSLRTERGFRLCGLGEPKCERGLPSEHKFGSIVVLLLFCVMSVFAYSGCLFGKDKQEINVSDKPMDRRIGVIRSLGGAKTSNNGTHILQLDDGNTILLSSSTVNLDDPMYKGVSVEVRGVFNYSKESKPLMEVMNIDVLEIYTDEEVNSVPTWEDYSNSGLGFSIKYRDDFEIEETDSGVAFKRAILEEESEESQPGLEDLLKSKSGESEDAAMDSEDAGSEEEGLDKAEFNLVSILTEPKGDKESLVEYLGLPGDDPTELLKAGITKSKVGADGLSAYKSTNENSTEITYFVVGLSDFYTISFVGSEDPQTMEDRNLFYEMLGSFELFAVSNMDSESVSGEEDDSENNIEHEDDSEDVVVEEDSEKNDSESDEDSENVIEDVDAESLAPSKAETVSLDDYNTFNNDSFEFAIQYPKNWYFAGGTSKDSNVIRSYDFADGPLEDDASPLVVLDLMSGGVPSGTRVNVNNVYVTKVVKGGKVEVYVEGADRVYRLSGAPAYEDVLLNMASTIN